GRRRARCLRRQGHRLGARRPHVGGSTRPGPRQHALLHPAVARGLRHRSPCGGSRMWRLRGIGCALALALGAGLPPARAQLFGLPPVSVPAPPRVIVPAPPPVIGPARPPVIVRAPLPVIAPAPPPAVVP